MKFFAALLVLVFSINSRAHPTQYKDAVAFMTWNQGFSNETWLTYSYRHDRAFAFRYMYTISEHDEVNKFYIPQYDLLLKRWNGEDYQANIYAYAGAGGHDRPTRNGLVGLGGIEADAETRKYFVMAKAEWMGSTVDTGMEKYEFRLGIAPYESAYEEIGSWLMIHYQYHPWLVKKQLLTPLARFYYKSVLWEIGSSFEGDYMLNLMFHF